MNLKRSDGAGGPGRPIFLVIVTDQWHPRVFGYAGHPVVRTPHIDALAAG